MVVFAHAARVEVDDVADVEAFLHLEHLVHLLLVSGDDVAGAAMVEDVGDLVADRVLVERHRHAPCRLRRHHRPVERRAVAADDGDVVARSIPRVRRPSASASTSAPVSAQVQPCQMPYSFSR